jgi:hypothetical protein
VAARRKTRIIYSKRDLLTKGEGDAVEFRKRPQCFTQILETSISKILAARKKREIE